MISVDSQFGQVFGESIKEVIRTFLARGVSFSKICADPEQKRVLRHQGIEIFLGQKTRDIVGIQFGFGHVSIYEVSYSRNTMIFILFFGLAHPSNLSLPIKT